MKITVTFLLMHFLVVLFVDAFTPVPPRSAIKKATSELRYIEEEPKPDVSLTEQALTNKKATDKATESIWPVDGPYERAIDCAVDEQIECDIDEISRLASRLSEFEDDECTMDVQTEEDCLEEVSARNDLKEALRAEKKLRDLQESIKTSKFVNDLQADREETWKNHWHNDYMEYYYM